MGHVKYPLKGIVTNNLKMPIIFAIILAVSYTGLFLELRFFESLCMAWDM
jgi:hypothetical protein